MLGRGDWSHQLTEALFTCGADINTRFNGGRTPLIEWASWTKESACVAPYFLLLERGANIDAQDDTGKTALHWLAWHTHFGILQKLADAGWLAAADLTLLDNAGETPLQIAQRWLRAVPSDVKRRSACDLLREHEALWTNMARPSIHR
jgi:ankyrin repeat protein